MKAAGNKTWLSHHKLYYYDKEDSHAVNVQRIANNTYAFGSTLVPVRGNDYTMKHSTLAHYFLKITNVVLLMKLSSSFRSECASAMLGAECKRPLQFALGFCSFSAWKCLQLM